MKLKPSQSLVTAACGVSYTSLVLTYFKLLDEPREALQDWAAANLPELPARKLQELTSCAFCASYWVALVATKGRPIKALQLAGMASITTSVVLAATR